MRVDEGIEGLVHISELAERHVEIPEQVVQVGDEIFVKVIDIDLERRRISLSLKQANDGAAQVAEFDPTLYGMAAEYDEEGNYKYPEGFDPETNDWLEGLRDAARGVGEAVRRGARPLGGAPRQVEEAAKADAEAAANPEAATSYSSGGPSTSSSSSSSTGSSSSSSDSGASQGGGTLASDEALAALREKLTGG